jgi:GTPase
MTESKEKTNLKRPERAVLAGVVSSREDKRRIEEYLDELAFLVDTAGGVVVERFVQTLEYPDPRTFMGSGRLQHMAEYIKEHEIDLLVFDDELSPSQMRNIEKVAGCRILDRNNLILDIFAKRARTANARVQVELAQYEYLLPRLTRLWTHLERQRGGIGMRGPGEREIETDRRVIRQKIALLKEKLKEIDKQKSTQRKNRQDMARVALVGYTNVGKSTLMNALAKADVFAEDKLFATLDTTVRKVVIENLPFLLADTVGFIRKLPHALVDSFKSTLDETREADILLHIIDISHPGFEDQINVVNQTLQEIGAGDKRMIYLFNKIDAYTWEEKEPDDLTPPTERNVSLEELKASWMAQANQPALFISAKHRTHFDELRNTLYQEIVQVYKTRFPHERFLF